MQEATAQEMRSSNGRTTRLIITTTTIISPISPQWNISEDATVQIMARAADMTGEGRCTRSGGEDKVTRRGGGGVPFHSKKVKTEVKVLTGETPGQEETSGGDRIPLSTVLFTANAALQEDGTGRVTEGESKVQPQLLYRRHGGGASYHAGKVFITRL